MANGIGPDGKVVGYVLTALGREHAYVYDGSEMLDLGTLGGHFSVAYDINRFNQVVGYSLTGEIDRGFVGTSFLWDGSTMEDLGISGNNDAKKINDFGQIVGGRQQDEFYVAFLYEDGQITDLGSIGGRGSWALSINNNGQIVGISNATIPGTEFTSNRGFLYENGSLIDLGSLGPYCSLARDEFFCYEESSATGISDSGQIVGFSSLPDSILKHAFRIKSEGMEDLGTLGGSQSWAYAVNESGQIVGTSLSTDDTAYHAFLFDQEKMYDLNDLIVQRPPGSGHVWGAADINDFGQIVGSSYLLNPLYPMVSPQRDLAFPAVLGPRLQFEYWVSRGNIPENCTGKFPNIQIQVKFTSSSLRGKLPPRFRSFVNSWITVGKFEFDCQGSEGWNMADLPLPSFLEGQNVDLTIRVREYGKPSNPTVHLRHLTHE